MSLGLLKPEEGVSSAILAQVMGVAKSTIISWDRLGVIEPIAGTKPKRYLVPTPAQQEEIRAKMRQRLGMAASLGGQALAKSGGSRSNLIKAHEALASSPEARARAVQTRESRSKSSVPKGLLTGPALCKQAGISESSLLRWRNAGYITHAYQCPLIKTLYFEPLLPERVRELRELGREKQTQVGKKLAVVAQAFAAVPGNAEARQERANASHLSTRPEGGYITAVEASKLTGVHLATIKDAIRRGSFETVRVRAWVWIREDSVQTWLSRRALAAQPQPRVDHVAAPLPKAKELVIAKPKQAAKAPAQKPNELATVAPTPGADYETVVSAAKLQPAFCGVLGFNVWRHNFTGEYQAASVSEKPQWPWRYHQKHYKNGWGHWSVASMNPSTGRVDL